MHNTAHGACLCGSIHFTAQLPSKWVVHCHCTRCQRAHGAAFVTWAGFDAEQVEIADPEKKLTWFASSTPLNSVLVISQRGFCSQCGSPMFFKSQSCAHEIHIARALFTSDLDRTPESHVHFDTQVDWVHIGEQLPAE